MAGRAEGIPGDVEPARASQELVGVLAALQEDDEAPELLRVMWTDVGSAGQHVLRVLDAADKTIDLGVAESAVDLYRTTYGLTGRLQQHLAAVGQVGYVLHSWQVVGILLQFEELCQHEVLREPCVIKLFCHDTVRF